MKTLKSLIFLLCFFSLSVNAATDGEAPLHALSKKIKSALNMPEALKKQKQPQKITIYFVVNECGDVTEADAKTENKDAKADLENQFMKMNFKGLQPCVRNSVDVNFIVY